MAIEIVRPVIGVAKDLCYEIVRSCYVVKFFIQINKVNAIYLRALGRECKGNCTPKGNIVIPRGFSPEGWQYCPWGCNSFALPPEGTQLYCIYFIYLNKKQEISILLHSRGGQFHYINSLHPCLMLWNSISYHKAGGQFLLHPCFMIWNWFHGKNFWKFFLWNKFHIIKQGWQNKLHPHLIH